MKNIDYEMLQEQFDFLAELSEDIMSGVVLLPSKYGEMKAFPVEYLDGLLELLGAVFDTNKCIHATCYENPDWESLKCFTCGVRVESDEEVA
jgi:hypothetical protein